MVRATLTDDEMEALDSLLGYIAESECSDYQERIDEGECVEDHAYTLYLKLSKLWE